MKTKVPQREFNFSSEPFRLVPESGIDTDHQCAQENQRQQDKAGAEKAQWWFEQMRKAVENSR